MSTTPLPPTTLPLNIALLLAAQKGDAEGVALALDQGAAPFCLSEGNFTPLRLAIRAKSLPCVTLLIQAGAPVNEPPWVGRGSLLRAGLDSNREECALALYRAGARSEGEGEGLGALYYAISREMALLAGLIIQTNPSSLFPGAALSGEHYFELACNGARVEIVELLLSSGCQPCQNAQSGRRPSLLSLFSAGAQRDRQIAQCARLLAEAGADVNLAHQASPLDPPRSPLMIAAEQNMPIAAATLIELGADWAIEASDHPRAGLVNAELLAQRHGSRDIELLLASAREKSGLSAALGPSASAPRSRSSL